MDLAFTPEEQKFRDDIRAWVRGNLPADISHKVHNALHLTRDDHQRWAKILGTRGGRGWGGRLWGVRAVPGGHAPGVRGRRERGDPRDGPAGPAVHGARRCAGEGR